MKMKNWAIVTSVRPFMPPEMQIQYLSGNVFGHPDQQRFPDGTGIYTSRIVGKVGEDGVTTKSGSVYILGDPHPDYEKQYPNAKERLLGSF